MSRCTGTQEALEKIPLSEGWHRQQRFLCPKMQQRHTLSKGPCRPVKPCCLLSSKLCGLMTEDQALSILTPRSRYYKTPEVWNSPNGRGKYGDPKKTDSFLVNSEEWRLGFRNQICIENQVPFLTDLSCWIETHTPNVNMMTINQIKATNAQKGDLTQAGQSGRTSPRKWCLSWDLQNRGVL